MKSTLAILALVTATSAFSPAPRMAQQQSTSLLMGGFLEGRGAKITIREDEDNAMWIDDGTGGRLPGSGKPKTEPKKPEPKKKSGGFKFPWDK